MMPRGVDTKPTERASPVPARRANAGPRLRPRLEYLEGRCLLSGWRPVIDVTRGLFPVPPVLARTKLIGDAGGLAGRNAAPAITAPHSTTDPDGDSPSPSEYATDRAKAPPGTFPGLSLSAESTYVIILESSIPHGTPGSSQQLPDLPFFGVIGSVVPGDLTDFCRLSLGSTSSSLDLGLISGAGGSDVPLQLQVFDGSGRVLAEWHSATQGDSPLHLELGGLAAGSTIYLGISTAGSSWASPAK